MKYETGYETGTEIESHCLMTPAQQSEETQSLACLFRLIVEHLLHRSVGLQPVLFVMLLNSAFFPTAQEQEIV